jgi:galactose mutarotase-like enzyme
VTTVSTDWRYKGFQAGILENEHIRLVVLPEVGGKILQLTHKASDRELLYRNPRVPVRPGVYGANFDNWWSGGIDEAFPNGVPIERDGEELPYLGEAWSLPWTMREDAPERLVMSVRGVIYPFQMVRRLELRQGEPFVRLSYDITNEGAEPFQFIWGIHAGLEVGPAARILIPATQGVIEESAPDDRLGASGSTYPWPESQITRLAAEPAGTVDFHYATGLTEGWLAAWDAQLGSGFGMSFPTDVFNTAWVWVVDGGWRGLRALAIEPWTGWPADLNDAAAAGRARTLVPGEPLTVDVRLHVFSADAPIAGFDSAGEPILEAAAR